MPDYRFNTLCLVLPIVVLSACSKTLEVDDAARRKAEVYITKENGGAPSLNFIAAWRARAEEDGLVCGEFESPPILKPTRAKLRYYFDAARNYGQVEMHEMWVGPQNSMWIVEQNRALFNDMWARSCAPFAPFKSRYLS